MKNKILQASPNTSITSTWKLLHRSCTHITEPNSQPSCQFPKFLLNPAFYSNYQDLTDLSPCFLSLPFHSILYTVIRITSLKTYIISSILLAEDQGSSPSPGGINPKVGLGFGIQALSNLVQCNPPYSPISIFQSPLSSPIPKTYHALQPSIQRTFCGYAHEVKKSCSFLLLEFSSLVPSYRVKSHLTQSTKLFPTPNPRRIICFLYWERQM